MGRYLSNARAIGASPRGLIGVIRGQLIAFAHQRQRADLVELLRTARARAPIAVSTPSNVVPWERLRLPHEVDGSAGTFCAPRRACMLDATNDYDAVHARLALHEAPTTQRANRKEAERLLLWAIVERGRV